MRNLIIAKIICLDDYYTEDLLNTYSNKDLLALVIDLIGDLYD